MHVGVPPQQPEIQRSRRRPTTTRPDLSGCWPANRPWPFPASFSAWQRLTSSCCCGCSCDGRCAFRSRRRCRCRERTAATWLDRVVARGENARFQDRGATAVSERAESARFSFQPERARAGAKRKRGRGAKYFFARNVSVLRPSSCAFAPGGIAASTPELAELLRERSCIPFHAEQWKEIRGVVIKAWPRKEEEEEAAAPAIWPVSTVPRRTRSTAPSSSR